ncbi:MAG: hypothetical protein NT025_04245 [bacterium]|nr:hypothetical protein [bacterium]
MNTSSQSYLKVQYDLRPAKQVERKMLIDGLQNLTHAGFDIAGYQYTGLGSTYFVDFILFHKLLGMSNMLSVEHDWRIKKRVRFNRPFRSVRIKIGKIGDVIPELPLSRKHLLWLDYDFALNADVLDDVFLAASRLTRGSILLVTVDVEPPSDNEDAVEVMKYYEDASGLYFPSDAIVADFAKSRLKFINVKIIENALLAGVAPRNIEFIPLFNFSYRDGHAMITVGGMIGGDAERRLIRKSQITKEPYYCNNFRTRRCEIVVPRVTRKERYYLDAAMPCAKNWKPKEFELRKKDIEAYRKIYRFFPSYAELLT